MTHLDITVRLRIELKEEPGKGWFAVAPNADAVAGGETSEEAIANLKHVIEHYANWRRTLMAGVLVEASS